MRQSRGGDKVVNACEERNKLGTPRLILPMKKINDCRHENPDAKHPKQGNDDTSQTKGRRALIARTVTAISRVLFIHDSILPITSSRRTAFQGASHTHRGVWPDTPSRDSDLWDITAQTWDNRPIWTVRPVMKSTILSVKLVNEELSTLSESIYDIVILGAGSGGYATALRAAQLGMKVALIDGDKVGGTCLHRGCIPTKAYLHAAETAEAVRESAKFGVNSTFNGIDMAQVGAYRDSVISGLYKGLRGLLKSRKVELISGWGHLADANTIEVGGQRITGRNIVLATGSYSRSIPGLDIGGRIISSDQALQMNWVPSSVVILGGGVIGLEFASVWRSFGAEVTIIEALPHLANNEDEAISKQLERAYRKRGIKFHTNTRFASATQSVQGVHVSTEDGKSFDADVLLVAVGRGPVTEGLGYEQVGITLERGFVITNERLHTGVGNIYAVGDIVPGLQLAHRGFMQGIFVAEEIAGLNPSMQADINIPRVTFCEPEIASVGMTEKQAREKYGDRVRTVEYNLAGNGKSSILATSGLIKLVSVKDGPIVGFHGIGARIGEQIGEGELMVNWEAYPSDVASLIHAHPSQNESLGEAAMALAGKPLHVHN